MKEPRAAPIPAAVGDARNLAKRLGWKQIIIIARSDDVWSGSSYGENKKECDEAGKFLDRCVEELR